MIPIWGTSTGLNPTLDLDFVGATSLDSRITFARGSTATFFDSTGTLQTAAVNAARFDTNPATLAPLGLLIEEQRTNSIRNNTMQGAVAGTPGTLPTNWSFFEAGSELTSAVVATGTENGITYIDIRVSGTVTAQRSALIFFETSTGVGASASQSWAQSLYLKLQAGSTANIEQINIRTDYYNSVPAFLSSTVGSALTVTSAALNTQRQSNSVTTPASTAFIQPILRVRSSASGAIDITLRIGLPQLEQGEFATSVIPTTTTALTRNADAADITGTNFSAWYNAVEGSLFGEFAVAGFPSASAFPSTATISDGTANNRININSTNTGSNLYSYAEVITGGVGQAGLFGASASSFGVGAIRKAIAAYAANDFAFTTQGLAAQTDASGTVPTVNRIVLGSGAGNPLNGWLRRVSYYPRRLPNSTLQALTA